MPRCIVLSEFITPDRLSLDLDKWEQLPQPEWINSKQTFFMFSNDTFSLHNRKDRSENVCERVCAGPSPLLLPVRTLHNIFRQYRKSAC